MKVAVLGLGEAGSAFASALAGAGDEVHGYDPAPVQAIDGVHRHRTSGAAVEGCSLVIAVTPASQARSVIENVQGRLGSGVLYADLSTGSPGLKETLEGMVARSGASFVDVALMAPVPGRGLATPALASGPAAERYAVLINGRGGRVEVVEGRAGAASARKLLRSVMMKGLAALLIESMEGATRYDQGEWLWRHLTEQLASIDEELMERLLSGTAAHAGRCLEEMEASRDLLAGMGVPADMTTATIARLRRIVEEGLPEIVTGTRIDQADR
jgi:3-hydroxyisobutyrate dehydrogenase-like beta-hydroxyacid dehydrogenase